jgi:multidrug transporter EmrE-like cation transporter
VCRCLRGDRAFAAAGSAYIELGNAAWGLTLVAVEFDYILLYRTGWKISMASLLANVSVALLLAGIGVLFYKDVLLPRQIIGIILCLAGVFFLRP